MKQYTAENILIPPAADPADPGLLLSITPESAGWELISFQVRRLAAGTSWSFETGENELALVNLSGRYTVESDRGAWTGIGGRRSPFEGAAHALYLPRRTAFTVTAEEAVKDRDRETEQSVVRANWLPSWDTSGPDQKKVPEKAFVATIVTLLP